MKKVSFHSFGCRTNQEENSGFASTFREKGYEVVDDHSISDIIIINSCSVTANTESKVKKFIKSLSIKYPNAEIAVTGCLAQQSPKEIAKIDKVKWVIGNSDKVKLPNLVDSEAYGEYHTILDKDSSISKFNAIEAPDIAHRTRFSVKIQEGCNHKCSFCIIPQLRGPSRSIKRYDILTSVKKALSLGYKELVITGTHIGQYKFENENYIDLLKDIMAIKGDFRVRLSSMNPSDCSDELFDLMKSNKKLCRHLHISVQSFSSEMLKMMHRNSKSMEILIKKLPLIKENMPDLSIGGDFIVGMPNESEELFLENLAILKKVKFCYGHVFKYSPRPGTVAAEQKNQISEDIKNRRSKILRDTLAELQDNFLISLIGTKERVIVEEEDSLKGVTGNYLRINEPNDNRFSKNSWVDIIITGYNLDNKKLSIETV